VKPPPFEYSQAGSVEEAVAVLSDGGDEAKVLAGGQSLVPLLNMRLARPSLLVDVNRVPDLDTVEIDGAVEIGALVRQVDALASPELGSAVPLLHAALRHVGHVATRSRGTVGGSIAHADPAAELPAVLLALDGNVTTSSTRGERTIPAGELFVGPFTTSLAPDELMTSVRVPRCDDRRYGFAELSRREGDFALAGVCVLFAPARVVLFGVAGTPVRVEEAEAALEANCSVDEVAELAARALEPVSDVHADGEYRRRIAQVLVRRASEQAERRHG
jgi:carbon-monoxide dehydrogenase medium subunit